MFVSSDSYHKKMLLESLNIPLRPKEIIVWFSSTIFLELVLAGGFFFPNQSHSYTIIIIASISPNKGANKSSLRKKKKSFYTSVKTVSECKQVNNNNS